MKKPVLTVHPVNRVVIFRFVVHLWREKVRAGRFVWRGSVTDARSGATKYFQSLPALARLMAKAVKTKPKE
ncbi:MAG: hypothetical protein HS100_21255 [Anaerolineales bacterium]|nr:hypothetical protein [Anaerolineales bacterium]MCK6581467.1 hypothetical protein [Anaerolineales bacterium]